MNRSPAEVIDAEEHHRWGVIVTFDVGYKMGLVIPDPWDSDIAQLEKLANAVGATSFKSGQFYPEDYVGRKLVLVLAMSGFHGALAGWRKDFEADRNTRPVRFYRIANEVPTVLMIAIVILVIVRPF